MRCNKMVQQIQFRMHYYINHCDCIVLIAVYYNPIVLCRIGGFNILCFMQIDLSEVEKFNKTQLKKTTTQVKNPLPSKEGIFLGYICVCRSVDYRFVVIEDKSRTLADILKVFAMYAKVLVSIPSSWP